VHWNVQVWPMRHIARAGREPFKEGLVMFGG